MRNAQGGDVVAATPVQDSHATTGALTGLGLGALAGAGIPEHEAIFYQGELEAGRSVITVHPAGQADDAATILRRYGEVMASTSIIRA
jgi:hypothetical protein